MKKFKIIKPKSIQLDNGIRIKRPANSPYYQYYFKVGGIVFRKTCGTQNQRKAEDIARKAYDKCVPDPSIT